MVLGTRDKFVFGIAGTIYNRFASPRGVERGFKLDPALGLLLLAMI